MELIIILAAVGSVVSGVLLRGDEQKRIARRLATASPLSISLLPDGAAAAARGTVAAPESELLIAPLSQRYCVFWMLVFEEVGAKDFVEIGRAHNGIPFPLSSGSSTARVVPENVARPALRCTMMRERPNAQHFVSEARYSRDFTLADPRVDRIGKLTAQVCRSPNHPSSSIRLVEYTVAPGDELLICGWVTRETDPTAAEDVSGDYRGALPTRPVLSGTKRDPLVFGP